MMDGEILPPALLKRKAVVYVRQSTQTQVQINLDSQRRQYDLVDEARRRGFRDVEVIDDDLGGSASGTVHKIMEYMALEKLIEQFDVVEGRVSAQDASLCAAKNDPVDLAAKIVELLDDPERRKAMGRKGRERVFKDLSWQTQIAALIAA